MTATPGTALPDYEEALARALAGIDPLPAERVPLDAADGRALREPIIADRDLPPFDRAQMDGYALRAADLAAGRSLPVVGVVPAGAAWSEPVPAGSCVRIATGAPLPADLDAVVEHEATDRGDPVAIHAQDVAAGRAVHPRGADARRGDVLVSAGVRLGPAHLGLAAAVGMTALLVGRRPRATLLTSGDEVVAPEEQPLPHQVRNSNAAQTTALLRRLGAAPAGRRHLGDDLAETIDAVGAAIASSDLVITIGGTSAGERDRFPDALDAHRVERRLAGAAIQPGKPVVVGTAPGGCTIVCLPGNPVSALACTCLFVGPIIRALLGLEAPPRWRSVRLAEPVRPNARRRAFRPARLVGDGTQAIVPRWAGSGDLAHVAATDGLLRLPVAEAPVPAGAALDFLPWP